MKPLNRLHSVQLIGDSITHSYDGAGSNVWKQVFEPRKAINWGFGGDLTQHALWRINHLPELKKMLGEE